MDVVPVRILYDTPDGRMKLFCKVKVVYGEPMPAAQFAMESRRDLKTLRANKQALLDAWEEFGATVSEADQDRRITWRFVWRRRRASASV